MKESPCCIIRVLAHTPADTLAVAIPIVQKALSAPQKRWQPHCIPGTGLAPPSCTPLPSAAEEAVGKLQGKSAG